MKVDIQSWSDVKIFVEREFSVLENVPVIFCSEEDGYSIEWNKNGLYCLRIWPPEEGKSLIEFHAVRCNVYHEWDIYLTSLVSHFENVLKSLFLTYGLK